MNQADIPFIVIGAVLGSIALFGVGCVLYFVWEKHHLRHLRKRRNWVPNEYVTETKIRELARKNERENRRESFQEALYSSVESFRSQSGPLDQSIESNCYFQQSSYTQTAAVELTDESPAIVLSASMPSIQSLPLPPVPIEVFSSQWDNEELHAQESPQKESMDPQEKTLRQCGTQSKASIKTISFQIHRRSRSSSLDLSTSMRSAKLETRTQSLPVLSMEKQPIPEWIN